MAAHAQHVFPKIAAHVHRGGSIFSGFVALPPEKILNRKNVDIGGGTFFLIDTSKVIVDIADYDTIWLNS